MFEAPLLVTGASGFIGSRVVARALERGWRVLALVVPGDLCPRLEAVRQHIQVVEGTLASLQSWQAQVAGARPRACIHLAWNATPGVYLTTPENLDWLRWSCALLEQLPSWGCQRCVGVGSAAEYDTNLGDVALTEAAPLRPQTLYAACKASLGFIGRQLAERAGTAFAWARIFQPYGPGEHPERLVSACIRSLLAGRRFETSAGTQVRDFLHVDDVASALLTLAESDTTDEVNVCSGEPCEVRGVLAAIGSAMARPELIAVGARAAQRWDPPFLYGDNTRLRALGWRPHYTLQSGLADSVAWWSKVDAPGSGRTNTKELAG